MRFKRWDRVVMTYEPYNHGTVRIGVVEATIVRYAVRWDSRRVSWMQERTLEFESPLLRLASEI
jgi:hypothetical protein